MLSFMPDLGRSSFSALTSLLSMISENGEVSTGVSPNSSYEQTGSLENYVWYVCTTSVFRTFSSRMDAWNAAEQSVIRV